MLQILLLPLGPWEIVAIIAVALLLFGGKKIPELARGLGKGIKEFKNASKEISSDDNASENKKED